jgi:DNA-binding response OmpR family regulator
MLALVVDDGEVSLEILKNALDQMGYEVLTANDGEDAMRLVRQHAVRLVITDWEMLRMNGIELCQAIRNEEFDGYVYVIMLTGRDSTEQKLQGLYAGADSFIVKPLMQRAVALAMADVLRLIAWDQRMTGHAGNQL